MDPTKAKAVIIWPVPKCTKDVRKFLGSSGYYRWFVEGYATIARPLNDLLVGHLTNPEARKKKSAKPSPFVWGEDQQKSFEMIIDLLTSNPVFGYDAYQLPIILHTDVLGTGLGAALCQTQEGGNRVIAYASHSLKPAKKNYPANKLEFLTLKWLLVRSFMICLGPNLKPSQTIIH